MLASPSEHSLALSFAFAIINHVKIITATLGKRERYFSWNINVTRFEKFELLAESDGKELTLWFL